MVRKITDRTQYVIEDNSPVPHRVDVKPSTIQAMQELFQAVVQYGTAAGSAARYVPTAHGKTGHHDQPPGRVVHRLHAGAAAGDRRLGGQPGQHADAARLRRHAVRPDLGSASWPRR